MRDGIHTVFVSFNSAGYSSKSAFEFSDRPWRHFRHVVSGFCERVNARGTGNCNVEFINLFPDMKKRTKYIVCKALAAVLREMRPRRIVALGYQAVEAFAGEKLKLNEVVGGFCHYLNGKEYVPVQFFFDHTSLQSNPARRVDVMRELTYLFFNVPSPSFTPHEGIKVIHVRSKKKALRVVEKMHERDLVGFDTEYNDKSGRLLCGAFAVSANKAYVIHASAINSVDVLDAISGLFSNGKTHFVAHNWKFDAHVFMRTAQCDRRAFIDTGKFWSDTSSMRKIDNPEQLSGLAVAEWMVGLGGHKQRINDLLGRSKNGPAFERAYDKDPDTIGWYCGGDAIATFRLKNYYDHRLAKRGGDKTWQEIIGPIGPVLFDIEVTGIKCDPEARDLLGRRLDDQITLCLESIRSSPVLRRLESRGIIEKADAFNPASSDQLRLLMFDKNGLNLKPLDYTSGGKSGVIKPKTDSITRKEYAADHQILADVSEFSRLVKLKSTYVTGWGKRIDEHDILHTSYRQDVARTGRLSSQNPNLQNIPRGSSDEAKMLRALITPHRSSDFILEVDYSQMELRCLAMESGDRELLRCFLENIDVHKRTAAFVKGCTVEEVQKADRQAAKPVNFGVVYGMSEFGLQTYAKNSYGVVMDLDACKVMIKKYFRLYPGVRRYQTALIKAARKSGRVWINWLGKPFRYRPVLDITSTDRKRRSSAERIVKNTPIQGLAADYTMRFLIAIHNRFHAGKLPYVRSINGTVHDSVWFCVSRKNADKAFREIAKVAVDFPTTLGVPLEVEGKAGKNLGEMSELGVFSTKDL